MKNDVTDANPENKFHVETKQEILLVSIYNSPTPSL